MNDDDDFVKAARAAWVRDPATASAALLGDADFVQAIRGCNQHGHKSGCPDAGGAGAQPKKDSWREIARKNPWSLDKKIKHLTGTRVLYTDAEGKTTTRMLSKDDAHSILDMDDDDFEIVEKDGVSFLQLNFPDGGNYFFKSPISTRILRNP